MIYLLQMNTHILRLKYSHHTMKMNSVDETLVSDQIPDHLRDLKLSRRVATLVNDQLLPYLSLNFLNTRVLFRNVPK